MKRKLKKETVDAIVQKMANDGTGEYLEGLLKISEVVCSQKKTVGEKLWNSKVTVQVVEEIKWLYGYEKALKETLELLVSKLEERVFSKNASHVTIMATAVCYCTIKFILEPDMENTEWKIWFENVEKSKRLEECLEILERHCAEKIDVQGFCEARRYIRIWDSEFNW